jgi:hypothetical protein
MEQGENLLTKNREGNEKKGNTSRMNNDQQSQDHQEPSRVRFIIYSLCCAACGGTVYMHVEQEQEQMDASELMAGNKEAGGHGRRGVARGRINGRTEKIVAIGHGDQSIKRNS